LILTLSINKITQENNPVNPVQHFLEFGCFAWALSISPVSDAMIRGLESEYGIPKNIEGDVIFLLRQGFMIRRLTYPAWVHLQTVI